MNIDFERPQYKDGEPCKHIGCLNHVSHPCEGCGRIAGRSKPKPEADRPKQIPAVMRDFASSEIMEDAIKACNDIQLRYEKVWIDIFKRIGGHPDTHNLIIPKKLENTLNIIPEKYKDSIFFTLHLDKDMLLTEKVKLDFGPVIPMNTTTQNLA